MKLVIGQILMTSFGPNIFGPALGTRAEFFRFGALKVSRVKVICKCMSQIITGFRDAFLGSLQSSMFLLYDSNDYVAKLIASTLTIVRS